MYSDPLTPGLFWRDDSPEEPRFTFMHGGVITSFVINTEPFLSNMRKAMHSFQSISLGAVGPSNHAPGTMGPTPLMEWHDEPHSGQDDGPLPPPRPANICRHGVAKSGLCRKCCR